MNVNLTKFLPPSGTAAPVVDTNTVFELTTRTSGAINFFANATPRFDRPHSTTISGTQVVSLFGGPPRGSSGTAGIQPFNLKNVLEYGSPPTGTSISFFYKLTNLPQPTTGHLVAISTGGAVPGCDLGGGSIDCDPGIEAMFTATVGVPESLDGTMLGSASVGGTVYRLDDVAQLAVANHFGKPAFTMEMVQDLGPDIINMGFGGEISLTSLAATFLEAGETAEIPTSEIITSLNDVYVVQSTASFAPTATVTGGDIELWAAYLSVFVPEPGDFDFDNDVDGNDFLQWQRNESPNGIASTDLDDWMGNYGTNVPLSTTSAAVPEPTAILLGVMATLLSMTSRRGSSESRLADRAH